MDSRYISSELLQKVPSTAICGQVGNDNENGIAYKKKELLLDVKKELF
jgi:hypothetical protein